MKCNNLIKQMNLLWLFLKWNSAFLDYQQTELKDFSATVSNIFVCLIFYNY